MKKYILLLFLFLMLSSCDVSGNSQSPIPDDQQVSELAESIPTPSDKNTCTITGNLYVNTESPSPVVGASLYLGEIISNAQETPIMATMNRISSLRAVTDFNGKFIFIDVPGNAFYSLIFDKVTESFMLFDPVKNDDLMIHCDGGTILDIGKLIYKVLP